MYAVDVAHCNLLTEAFRAEGFRAESVDGKTLANERHAIMQRVRSGRTQILVNVEIATEGVDVPEFEAVLMVRPTLSRCLYLQMIGRGLRASPGKTDCLVLDHAGNVALHGLPTDAFPLSLNGVPVPKPEPKPTKADADDVKRERANGPSGRRYGDPDAELSAMRPCALLNAATDEEVLSTKMVLRRGMRFADASYDVTIAPPGRSGGKWRATCGARTAFLPEPAWCAEWCAKLGELLCVPGRAMVKKHAESMAWLLHKGRFSSAGFVAKRLIEQWGAAAATRLLQETAEGGGTLRTKREGFLVQAALRHRLATELQADALQPVPSPVPPPPRLPAGTLRVMLRVWYDDDE